MRIVSNLQFNCFRSKVSRSHLTAFGFQFNNMFKQILAGVHHMVVVIT